MNLASHLPALQVVLPLLAAPLVLLLRERRLAWLLSVATTLTCLLISISLWQWVQDGSVLSYAIGSWPPPWGIEYRIDRFNAFMLVLISAIAALVAVYTQHSIDTELPARLHTLFHTMFLLCVAGLLGITITGDAFNIFVFLEISSLSTYVLIAMGRQRKALVAAYQYLIMGTIGATLIVIGIGMLYLLTGTLNLADMAARLSGMPPVRAEYAALAFITVGLSLKLALFPLHQWLPNAYAYAPSAVSSFLAATATKVALYVLIRFFYTVFGQSLIEGLALPALLTLLALAGMFVGSAVALFQTDLRRLAAFSSIAQVGYIVLGIAIGNATGLTSAVLHLFNHGITKGAWFLLMGVLAYSVGSTRLDRLQGLGKTMPVTSLAIVLCGLSLIGVPGTAGFVSKWMLIQAAVEAGQWWLVFLVVASSLLAIAYVWRFVEIAYLQAPAPDAHLIRRAPLTLMLPALALAAATVWFGLDTRFPVGAASGAAQSLLQGAP